LRLALKGIPKWVFPYFYKHKTTEVENIWRITNGESFFAFLLDGRKDGEARQPKEQAAEEGVASEWVHNSRIVPVRVPLGLTEEEGGAGEALLVAVVGEGLFPTRREGEVADGTDGLSADTNQHVVLA